MSVDDRTRSDDGTVSLASFIAWLGARVEDEPTRHRCRLVAQAFLEWSWADGGSAGTRRARFVTTAARRLGFTRSQVEQALERLGEHRAVVARTAPVDDQDASRRGPAERRPGPRRSPAPDSAET